MFCPMICLEHPIFSKILLFPRFRNQLFIISSTFSPSFSVAGIYLFNGTCFAEASYSLVTTSVEAELSIQVHTVLTFLGLSGWRFGFFPYIGNNHPNWLILFRGVETTNQVVVGRSYGKIPDPTITQLCTKLNTHPMSQGIFKNGNAYWGPNLYIL